MAHWHGLPTSALQKVWWWPVTTTRSGLFRCYSNSETAFSKPPTSGGRTLNRFTIKYRRRATSTLTKDIWTNMRSSREGPVGMPWYPDQRQRILAYARRRSTQPGRQCCSTQDWKRIRKSRTLSSKGRTNGSKRTTTLGSQLRKCRVRSGCSAYS
jgi:hypothetical protein